MISTRPAEIRAVTDLQMQARLERMLAARRAAEAAREARYRTYRTPSMQAAEPKDIAIVVIPEWVFWIAVVMSSAVLTASSYWIARLVLPLLWSLK